MNSNPESLVDLQREALRLRDEEQEFEVKINEIRAALANLNSVREEEQDRQALQAIIVKYLNILSQSVEVRRHILLENHGSIYVEYSDTKSINLEVFPETRFKDLVKEVLCYLEIVRDLDLDDPSDEIQQIFEEYFFRDIHGAVFLHDGLVSETFQKETALSIARLSKRTEKFYKVFDPEQELTNYYKKYVEYLNMNDIPDVSSPFLVRNKIAKPIFIEYHTVEEFAGNLLLQSDYGTQIIARKIKGRNKSSQKRKASELRMQLRRRGLCVDCILNIIYFFLTFFAAFSYIGYSNSDPEYACIVYQNNLQWDVAVYPNITSYFQNVIVPFKMAWAPQEVRIRQLRVYCDSNFCPPYSPEMESYRNFFNSTAIVDSNDINSFEWIPNNRQDLKYFVVPISSYFENDRIVVDTYAANGGFYKFWPSSSDNLTVPSFEEWIDPGTRLIEIEFNTYEVESDLIVTVKVLAQYLFYETGINNSVNVTGLSQDICATQPVEIAPAFIIRSTIDSISALGPNVTTMTILTSFAFIFALSQKNKAKMRRQIKLWRSFDVGNIRKVP